MINKVVQTSDNRIGGCIAMFQEDVTISFFFFDFKAFAIYLKKEKKEKYGTLAPQKTRVPKDCKGSPHWCDHITPLSFS